MAFANTIDQTPDGFVDDSDLSLSFAVASHFGSMADNLFNGIAPLRPDTSAFPDAPDLQFCVNPDLLDLSRAAYNDAAFADNIPHETPMLAFNPAQASIQHTNEISSQVLADPFTMEDILIAQPVVNCQTSISAFPKSQEKITIIKGRKVIQLDPAEALTTFTASGLGMLMETGEINDDSPP